MRRVLLTLLALILATFAGALWYASEKGFTNKWRNYVSEEFRKRGLEVTLRRLTLDPVRGLVAKEVRIFDARDRRRTLAVIDEMALQVNLANLARGQNFLEALDLSDANLSLPLDPERPNRQKIEIAHLNARLVLPPQQVYLARADAEIFGLHITASGRLIHPEALRTKMRSAALISPELAAQIFEEISAIKVEGEPPVLSLTFSGDLAEPDQIFVDLALWGERLRRRQYALQSVYVAASYRAGVLDLKQLIATDSSGELRLSGLWEPAAHQARIQMRSSIDLPALARAVGDFPWLDDYVFYSAPNLDLHLDLPFGGSQPVRALGHVSLKKFAYRGVVFDHGATDFSWDGGRWSLRDLKVARAGKEELSGDVMQTPTEFRARVRSGLNPKALRPLLTGRAAETLAQFDFTEPPQLSLDAHGTAFTPEALVVDGDVTLGSTTYRGVPAESATGRVHYENQVLSVAPFRIERSEGGGGGNVYFDFHQDQVRLDRIKARVNPPDVAMWIDPKLVNDVLPYHFSRQAPDLLVDGLVDIGSGTATRLTIDVDAGQGMDYSFLQKELSASRLSGKLLFTRDRLKISQLTANVLGGVLKGEGEFPLSSGTPAHHAKFAVENVDFGSLSKLYFGRTETAPAGRLNGHGEWTGVAGDDRKLEGRGEFTLTDGDLFSVPFLQPLAGMVAGSHDGPQQAAASVTLANGIITTDNLIVQGSGFGMLGHGKVSYLDDRIDFRALINSPTLPGLVLAPMSQWFEYAATKSFSKPEWHLEIAPPL